MDRHIQKILTSYYLKFRNLILYGIIGSLSVGIDFVVFYGLTHFFPEYYLLVNVVSVNCGIINSFVLNRYFNFKVKNKTALRFALFYAIGILGLLISSGLLWVMVDYMEIHILPAKISTILVVTIFQFVLNKNVTFKQKKD